MKIPFKASILPAMLTGLLAGTAVWADDDLPDTEMTDGEVTEAVSGVAGTNIAGMFTDFAGGEAESQSLVDGLRNGSIQYVDPEAATTEETADTETPETAETEDATTGMGYGNVMITMSLAQQLALASAAEAGEGEVGLTTEESVNEILRLRQVEGMGWGQVAKELGVNLGEVISDMRSNRPDKAEHAKAEKAEKAERMAKAERMERPERAAKMERPEKPERPAKPERVGR